MGSSLFGKLKAMMSRQKTSEISGASVPSDVNSNLSRIGLAAKTSASAPASEHEVTSPGPAAPDVQLNQQAVGNQSVAAVGVQFFAEVPHQQCAEEIVTVSKRASNCTDAVAHPAGGDLWNVVITLNMPPVPQDIHTVESTLQAWTEKLGGSSKGWGLSQNQAA